MYFGAYRVEFSRRRILIELQAQVTPSIIPSATMNLIRFPGARPTLEQMYWEVGKADILRKVAGIPD
jgi:hypothetical protein